MNEFLNDEPNAKKWFRPFINAENFISGKKIWLLTLQDIKPNEIRNSPKIKNRINAVKEFKCGFEGVDIARCRGSEVNDTFISADGKTSTNFSGGIQGGISNGNEIYFEVFLLLNA